jgi:hypothetical protein
MSEATPEPVEVHDTDRSAEKGKGAGRLRKWHSPGNLTSAVYGSVLAASVIIGAGSGRGGFALAAILVVTGLIFWISHVYAETVASVHGGWQFASILTGMRHEWPLMLASVLPALAALLAGLFPHLSRSDGAWLALAVAIGELMVWDYTAVRQAGLTGASKTRALLLNLSIGVVMVGLKLVVPH